MSQGFYDANRQFTVVVNDIVAENKQDFKVNGLHDSKLYGAITNNTSDGGNLNNKKRLALALRVVERPQYYEGEFSPQELGAPNEGHSLHFLCQVPFDLESGIASTIINNFSRIGETVLDPNCRSGTVGVEAALNERMAILADTDPVALAIARGKLFSADLTEVALFLQMNSLKAPVICDQFEEVFSPFFDINTFREISFLRRALSKNRNDRHTPFLTALTLGILHGRGAGNLSVYTPSEIILSPEQQQDLNFRRRQSPDYRALAPRLLRRSAITLQDGLPSILRNGSDNRLVLNCLPRSLDGVSTGRVDLVVFNPKLPRHSIVKDSNWLRRWFIGLNIFPEACSYSDQCYSPAAWLTSMNETLLELARVTRAAGKVAIVCDRYFNAVDNDQKPELVRDLILKIVENDLVNYFEAECYMRFPQKRVNITGREKSASTLKYRSSPDGVLVLRRK